MMGVSFSEDRIDFRGKLTDYEIKQIVRSGGADTLQTDTLPLDISTLQRLNEANTHIVRQIIFPDGRM